MKTKFIKTLNLFLLFSTLAFFLFYKNWNFYIEGRGFDNENEIFFGLIELLGYRSCPWYEVNIFIASLIYLIFLLILFLANTFLKQNHWSNLTYLLFNLSVLTTFAMIIFNFENTIDLKLSTTTSSIPIGYFGIPKLSIEMDTISLATFWYSIFLSIISILFFIYSIIFISKENEKLVEDHLIE